MFPDFFVNFIIWLIPKTFFLPPKMYSFVLKISISNPERTVKKSQALVTVDLCEIFALHIHW